MGMRWNIQVLADRIFAGEEPQGEVMADNDLVRSNSAFVAGEEPATQEWNTESAEIAGIGLAP